MGLSQDLPQFEGNFDEQDYKIDIQWVLEIGPHDRDMLVFMKVFFNSMLKKIKFKQIGRNHFNPAQGISIKEHNIELWPGFQSSLG